MRYLIVLCLFLFACGGVVIEEPQPTPPKPDKKIEEPINNCGGHQPTAKAVGLSLTKVSSG